MYIYISGTSSVIVSFIITYCILTVLFKLYDYIKNKRLLNTIKTCSIHIQDEEYSNFSIDRVAPVEVDYHGKHFKLFNTQNVLYYDEGNSCKIYLDTLYINNVEMVTVLTIKYNRIIRRVVRYNKDYDKCKYIVEDILDDYKKGKNKESSKKV